MLVRSPAAQNRLYSRDLRSTAGQVDLLSTSFASHCDNFTAGSTSNNTVVNQKHIAILELGLHGIELAANPFLAGLLFWHNECSENVSVLHEAMAIRLVEI